MRLLARTTGSCGSTRSAIAPRLRPRRSRPGLAEAQGRSHAAPRRSPNLLVLSPLAVPAWGSRAVRTINRHFLRWQVRRAMRKLRFRRPINWVFNPAAAVLAGHLGEDLVIYYCVDEYTAFSGVPTESLIELEARTAAAGRPGGRLGRAIAPVQGDVQPAPLFWSVTASTSSTSARRSITTPKCRRRSAISPGRSSVIFGLMSPDWIDVRVLRPMPRHFDGGSLVLLGKVTTDLGPLTALSERAPPRTEAIRFAARLLQGVRRRGDPVPDQRGDAEREPAQGARVPGRRAAGRVDARSPRSRCSASAQSAERRLSSSIDWKKR